MLTQISEKEEAPDLQRSFVFGNSVVKPQTSHSLPEDAEPREPAEYYSTETLCLCRNELKHISGSILKNSSLKYLYLEGNQISNIPASLFISLPNLLWLDFRNNQIASLPAEIGLHRSLRTLLLEGNPISELPPELGNVITLKGLNLRNCPITFPPQDIVHLGLQGILQYLRSTMAERQVNMRKTPAELPVVEKLQLLELMGSSIDEQDESVDDDDLQKFKELKHKMILLDKAELSSAAQGDKGPKSHPLIITRRKKATAKAGIIPELPLFDTQRCERPQEKRQTAVKEKAELKEKQTILEQKKNQDTLQRWQTKAKITQEKKMLQHNHKNNERQKKQREVAEADSKLQKKSTISNTDTDEDSRSVRELERQIRAHVERVQERRRNPRGTTSEQMVAAEEDVEEMRKLQTRLLEQKRNQARDLGKCFIIYTGDTWPCFVDK